MLNSALHVSLLGNMFIRSWGTGNKFLKMKLAGIEHAVSIWVSSPGINSPKLVLEYYASACLVIMTEFLVVLPNYIQVNAGVVPQLCKDRFLPNPSQFILFSRVRGSVTNNNGFRTAWLDLLTLLLKLQLITITTAHNRWFPKARFVSSWTTSVLPSTVAG
jgi:hypothetical protein